MIFTPRGDGALSQNKATRREAARALWLGRLLTWTAWRAQGRRRLERALALDPQFRTYKALGKGPLGDTAYPLDLAAPPATPCLVLDISDLLSFFAVHGLVTGIQRVQLALLTLLLDPDRPPGGGFGRILFCFAERGWPWRLETADLRALIARAGSAGRIDAGRARRLVRRIKARAAPCAVPAGSAYLVLGAFWAGENHDHRMRIRSAGIAFGVLVHDLFPVTMPAFCEEGAAASFETHLRQGLAAWDFVVANSAYTAGCLRDYVAEHGFADRPILAVPLAHSNGAHSNGAHSNGAHSNGAPTPARPGPTRRGRRFVLCVGTIEPRKNLGVLIEAWTRLGEVHADLPDLVLVGRRGWRMGAMVGRLNSPALRRRGVRWLETVSDAQLAALYQGCLFTVFPSLAEGWGLPIGEALVHGKVCVTSNTTAMPEVGGAFAVYVDPQDPGALQGALQALLYDGHTLARREAAIRDHFRPRTWSDMAADLIGAVAACLDLQDPGPSGDRVARGATSKTG